MSKFAEQIAEFERLLSLCAADERKSVEDAMSVMIEASKKLPKPLGAVALSFACIKAIDEISMETKQ